MFSRIKIKNLALFTCVNIVMTYEHELTMLSADPWGTGEGDNHALAWNLVTG